MCQWYLRSYGQDPTNPNSYTLVGTNPPSCPGSGKVCAICAEDNGTGRPIITSYITSQMVNALSSGVDQPWVLLRTMN